MKTLLSMFLMALIACTTSGFICGKLARDINKEPFTIINP
jgi:hypothetical protein